MILPIKAPYAQFRPTMSNFRVLAAFNRNTPAMKNPNACIPALFGTLLMVAAIPVHAQTTVGTTYLTLDAGPAFTQDTTVKGTDDKARFDTGVRADIAFGYTFVPSLSVEIETGIVQNHVDRIGQIVHNPPADPYETGTADLTQIPFLVDLSYDVPIQSPIRPYFGAGAGGVASILDARFPDNRVQDTDFTFAFQGFAGVRYDINSRIGIGVVYKFLGTLDQNWSQHGFKVGTGPLYTHSVVAVFAIKL
jgi:OmpA-OmpF porin, OOP family